MENKINIAEILKDCSCSSGMELDCTIYEDVYFDYVDELNIIHCYIQHETYKTSLTFNQYGIYNSGIKSKCVIFPKGKTTWEGFQKPFEDGDILISGLEDNPFIFKRINGLGNAQCYCAISCFGQLILNNDNWTCIKGCRLATEEEKEKLFQAIKDNGYKWNPETKTLEKLIKPKFKVGDKIRRKGSTRLITIKDVRDNYYIITILDGFNICYITDKLLFNCQDEYELVHSNKFDINTLKPFDKVLVRNAKTCVWTCDLYSHYSSSNPYNFVCTSNAHQQCIPYNDDTKYLLGTTNDCDEFYKNWK